MAPFLSFERLLRKYLRTVKPNLILEWGVGNSTLMMIQECPQAQIDTLEHDRDWFLKWELALRPYSNNVRLHHILLDEGYSTFPRHEYDLIFIDGRRRVECLKTAKAVVSKTGVVILHDSERERYATGKALFEIVEEEAGTAVMKT